MGGRIKILNSHKRSAYIRRKLKGLKGRGKHGFRAKVKKGSRHGWIPQKERGALRRLGVGSIRTIWTLKSHREGKIWNKEIGIFE